MFPFMQRFGGTATPYYAIKGNVKELIAKVQAPCRRRPSYPRV